MKSCNVKSITSVRTIYVNYSSYVCNCDSSTKIFIWHSILSKNDCLSLGWLIKEQPSRQKLCFSLICINDLPPQLLLSIVTYSRFISKENCVCVWHLDVAHGPSCAQNEVFLRLLRHNSDHVHVSHANFSAFSASIFLPGLMKILLLSIQNFRSYGLLSDHTLREEICAEINFREFFSDISWVLIFANWA